MIRWSIPLAAAAGQAGYSRKARQLYYANILSGLKTHERNDRERCERLDKSRRAAGRGGRSAVKSAVTGAPHGMLSGWSANGRRVHGPAAGFREALFSLRNGVNRSALTQSLSAAEAGIVCRAWSSGRRANPFNWPGRALDSQTSSFEPSRNQKHGLSCSQARREELAGATAHRSNGGAAIWCR
jgi:hypothetical protein